ncbi:hypothetical protein BBH99_08990 [Chryseobacterium contaminans]|uniref:Uncharacterized protein n=1 Tax=Chryseobacterium contaminans TaxID=1423959 RepID=A0A1M6ZDL3_9FLAO|nr:hypothetical protein [Chryseobacterium contaminans]OCA78280.1 hypothetical protein BBH99_08990 [Chryseobacterium contaminans]SHL28443.1 hypothetical protein SAMN05444407_103186 [Chryseobacterium contaminans]
MYITRIISLFFIFAVFFGNGQVGINTKTPLATLDVQGNLGIRKKIYLGGSDGAQGILGQKGTVLVSQGQGLPPVWKMLRVPPFDPFLYFSFYNIGVKTQNGLAIGNATSGSNIYTENQSLTSFLGTVTASGGVINDLTQTVTINNPESILAFSFETIFMINSTAQYQGADIAIGIFVDDKLKGVRVYTLDSEVAGLVRDFYTFNLIAAAQNLSVGQHTVKVACTRRSNNNNFTGDIGIGKSVYTNLNDFMMQSSFMIESYEKPNPTNTTPVYIP